MSKAKENRSERPGKSLSSPWSEKRKQSKGFGATQSQTLMCKPQAVLSFTAKKTAE